MTNFDFSDEACFKALEDACKDDVVVLKDDRSTSRI